MLNIATTDCTVYQTTLNLYESIKHNCSQDFVFHVFSHGITEPIRAQSSKQFIVYHCPTNSKHSAVRHSDVLNQTLKYLPLQEEVLICDADIYLVHHFDRVLGSICGRYENTFVAARSLHDQSLPHPTLFYGKLQLLIDNNATFSAHTVIQNGRECVVAETETGHELKNIPNWVPLQHGKADVINRKQVYQISHDNTVIAYHFRNGRKYSKFTDQFKKWAQYCVLQNEQLKSLI